MAMTEDNTKEENKIYLEAYLKLEEAYAMLRYKCQNCFIPDCSRPARCDECIVPKLEYYIEKAIMLVKSGVRGSIIDLDKEYVMEHLYKVYNKDARRNYLDINWKSFDYVSLYKLLKEATISCGDCHGTNCMGCLIGNLICQTVDAKRLIEEHLRSQLEQKFEESKEDIDKFFRNSRLLDMYNECNNRFKDYEEMRQRNIIRLLEHTSFLDPEKAKKISFKCKELIRISKIIDDIRNLK